MTAKVTQGAKSVDQGRQTMFQTIGLEMVCWRGKEHTLASTLREHKVRVNKFPLSLVGLGRAKELVARRLIKAILVRKAIACRCCAVFDEPIVI